VEEETSTAEAAPGDGAKAALPAASSHFTFCPGVSTCTPAVTTTSPWPRPCEMTASLPSAPATATGCRRTVMVPASTSHTAVRPLSSFRADSGSLATPDTCGKSTTTVMVWPRLTVSEAWLPRSAFTRNVRVTGSAAAAISRTCSGSQSTAAPQARALKALGKPANARIWATLSSGTENTTSRGPFCATRTTVAPAATTMPGSASTAVTTPATSLTSTA
jgi:hypothetical protein